MGLAVFIVYAEKRDGLYEFRRADRSFITMGKTLADAARMLLVTGEVAPDQPIQFKMRDGLTVSPVAAEKIANPRRLEVHGWGFANFYRPRNNYLSDD